MATPTTDLPLFPLDPSISNLEQPVGDPSNRTLSYTALPWSITPPIPHVENITTRPFGSGAEKASYANISSKPGSTSTKQGGPPLSFLEALSLDRKIVTVKKTFQSGGLPVIKFTDAEVNMLSVPFSLSLSSWQIHG